MSNADRLTDEVEIPSVRSLMGANRSDKTIVEARKKKERVPVRYVSSMLVGTNQERLNCQLVRRFLVLILSFLFFVFVFFVRYRSRHSIVLG